jgi:hypothetical protein
VLRLHEEHPPELIEKAVEQALSYGCLHADGVRLCLRQLSQTEPLPVSLDLSEHPQLQSIGHQAPNLERYNQLLGGPSCP